MKGRAKTIVIRRQALQKSTSPTYNHQGTSTITRRSVVSPHYAQGRLTQTEPVKKIEDPSAPTFVSTLEDPKLTAFRESIEDGDTFENINDNDLNLLLAHTREYQQTCAAERRYDKAHNAKELVEKIKNEIADRQARIVPDQKAIDDAEKEIQEKNDELQQFDEETEKRREEILNKQQKQTEKFMQEWSNLIPQKYRKSSATLLQLKQIEKNLILTGDYLKAKETQRQIKKIEMEEAELKQMDLNIDYANAKSQLEEKQRTEMLVFEQKRKEVRETINVGRTKEIQVLENRINVVMQKEIGNRRPRSMNTSKTINYATSFQHIAKESNFGIDPLLPKLRPPTDKRQYRIRKSEKKPIVVKAPRAYVPKNDASLEQDDNNQNNLFQTSVRQNQIKKITSSSSIRSKSGGSSQRSSQRPSQRNFNEDKNSNNKESLDYRLDKITNSLVDDFEEANDNNDSNQTNKQQNGENEKQSDITKQQNKEDNQNSNDKTQSEKIENKLDDFADAFVDEAKHDENNHDSDDENETLNGTASKGISNDSNDEKEKPLENILHSNITNMTNNKNDENQNTEDKNSESEQFGDFMSNDSDEKSRTDDTNKENKEVESTHDFEKSKDSAEFNKLNDVIGDTITTNQTSQEKEKNQQHSTNKDKDELDNQEEFESDHIQEEIVTNVITKLQQLNNPLDEVSPLNSNRIKHEEKQENKQEAKLEPLSNSIPLIAKTINDNVETENVDNKDSPNNNINENNKDANFINDFNSDSDKKQQNDSDTEPIKREQDNAVETPKEELKLTPISDSLSTVAISVSKEIDNTKETENNATLDQPQEVENAKKEEKSESENQKNEEVNNEKKETKIENKIEVNLKADLHEAVNEIIKNEKNSEEEKSKEIEDDKNENDSNGKSNNDKTEEDDHPLENKVSALANGLLG